MRKNFFAILMLIFLALASSAFAMQSYIVGDTTTPQGVRSLYVNALDGESLVYAVDLEPNTTYSLSFWYKLKSGKFRFEIDGAYVSQNSDQFWKTNWNPTSYTFTTDGEDGDPAEPHELRFTAYEGDAIWFLDAIQLEHSPEPTKFNQFKTDVGCCPFDFCYTGGAHPEHPECIHDDFYEKNVSEPPLGFTLAAIGNGPADTVLLNADAGYRCINGSWVYSRPKFSPIYDKAGFCPKESQCFIGGSSLASVACKEHETFHDYNIAPEDEPIEMQSFYCYNGNWTTRTKEIALQMLAMTDDTDTYTIFCDKFDRSLNPGNAKYYWRDYVGEDISSLLMGDSVNEFCVMDLNGQIIVGTSLKRHINDTGITSDCTPCNSVDILNNECDPQTNCFIGVRVSPPPINKPFIELIKGPDKLNYCDDAIENTDGFYHPCLGNDVYYNAKLQTAIFTKPQPTVPGTLQSVPFKEELSLIGRAWEAMKRFVRSLLGTAGIARPVNQQVTDAEFDFVQNAGSFNRLYISYSPDGPNGNPREIKGIIETRAHKRINAPGVDIKTFIDIDYLNYQVPICKYFYQHNLPHLQRQISGIDNAGIHCAPVILDDKQWKYSVFVEQPLFGNIAQDDDDVREWTVAADSFWNDMTASIRTKPWGEFENSIDPKTPTFETAPAEHPVVGSKVRFALTSAPQEGERFIAMTWDFNDSKSSTSIYNVTAEHIYDNPMTAPPYYPSVRVMNQYYKIATSEEYELPVDVGPAVYIEELPQIVPGELRINVSFPAYVNSPVGFVVDWDDSLDLSHPVNTTSDFMVDETPWIVFTHVYDFGTDTRLNPDVKVRGTDRDGVPFDNHQSIIVNLTLSP